MALFGGTTVQNRPRSLIEFKAGKMNFRAADHMVYPDNRKGLVYIHQTLNQQIHFCWKDRSNDSNKPESEIVILPGEVEFKRVTQTNTGRVYILKWKSSSNKSFFWMQEPREDKDEEICKKVNEILNSRRGTGVSDASGTHPFFAFPPLLNQMTGGATAGGLNPTDLNPMLQGMSPADIVALIDTLHGGGFNFGAGAPRAGTSTQRTGTPMRINRSSRQTGDSRPNTAPAATRTEPTNSNSQRQTNTNAPNTSSSTSSKPKQNVIEISALTNVLSNLNTGAADKISKPENFVQLLSNKDVQEKLRPKLPTDWTLPTDEGQCRTMIDSVAFKSALEAFSSLLKSRQLGSVLDQFQFPSDVIESVNNGDIDSFAKALENHYKSKDRESLDKTMDTN